MSGLVAKILSASFPLDKPSASPSIITASWPAASTTAPSRARFRGGQVELRFAKWPNNPYSPVHLAYPKTTLIEPLYHTPVVDSSFPQSLNSMNGHILCFFAFIHSIKSDTFGDTAGWPSDKKEGCQKDQGRILDCSIYKPTGHTIARVTVVQ